MIVHLFNSSSVSGPERLVLPALANFRGQVLIVNLKEERIPRLRESDPLQEYARTLNLEYHAISVRSRWDRQAISELHQLLRQRNPDLVHAQAIKASVYLLQARRKSESHPIPIVSTHHGVHGLPDWKVRLYEFLVRRFFLKHFDRALTVSSADYDFLLMSGIDKDRLRLHLNGIQGRCVTQEERQEEARKARAQWLPQESGRDRLFLMGVVGRLSAEKDHARLLRVLACLKRLPVDRDWRCLIFGFGKLEGSLRRQARDLGLEDRLSWMGYRSEVGNELAGLDLLLSFSKAEGLPINLLEAGWTRTPVMATRVGGVTDLIPDESYGSLVRPEEPAAESAREMQELISTEGESKLRAQGDQLQKRVMQDFTQEKWLERLTEIYAELKVDLKTAEEKANWNLHLKRA